MELVEICIMVGFCKSKSEARRLISSGAIRLDDKKITDPTAKLYIDVDAKKYFVLSDLPV
jgi:tyrosyl-tRNA synthetase